jgi:hypothetical protein
MKTFGWFCLTFLSLLAVEERFKTQEAMMRALSLELRDVERALQTRS